MNNQLFNPKGESLSELVSRLLKEKQTGETAFRELQKKLSVIRAKNNDHHGRGRK
jgi:hypothetical protein